ncbi:MAG: succinate dehydrogenase, hydrophobic membrane anchor protein [Alphaproteobacteria bacterium]|nr:succinate dehydrogenase, hydrophobic membrane anchor protein [Alphaproteobacteria bacterium]
MSLRTPLADARGHGSAKEGTHHWWVQRVSGVALIPLTIWFVFSVACMVGGEATLAGAVPGSDYVKFSSWAAEPFNATALILLIVASFHHAQLGVQVVIEDYVHGFWHTPLLVAVKLLSIAFAVGGTLAVLKIAL